MYADKEEGRRQGCSAAAVSLTFDFGGLRNNGTSTPSPVFNMSDRALVADYPVWVQARRFPWLPEETVVSKKLKSIKVWMKTFDENVVGLKVDGVETRLYAVGVDPPVVKAPELEIEQFHKWVMVKSPPKKLRQRYKVKLKQGALKDSLSYHWSVFVKDPDACVADTKRLWLNKFGKSNEGLPVFIHFESLDAGIPCAVRPQFNCFCCVLTSHKFKHLFRHHSEYQHLPQHLRDATAMLDKVHGFAERTPDAYDQFIERVREDIDFDLKSLTSHRCDHEVSCNIEERIEERIDARLQNFFEDTFDKLKVDLSNYFDDQNTERLETVVGGVEDDVKRLRDDVDTMRPLDLPEHQCDTTEADARLEDLRRENRDLKDLEQRVESLENLEKKSAGSPGVPLVNKLITP